jgi:stage V sporulation protein G
MYMAEITDVRIYRVEGTGNLRAYAAVTLDESYVVHGLRVLEGEAGFWVGMPASKNKRGEFKDIFHPITREARDILVKSVISKYEEGPAGEPSAPEAEASESAEEAKEAPAEESSEKEEPAEEAKEAPAEEPEEEKPAEEAEQEETPEEKVEE